MQRLKAEIISHLLFQSGILACLMRKHTSLGRRIAAWFVGESPILLIGGEPGNGKSLLMGDLILQHRLLTKIYPDLGPPPALISYDRVHYLFLKCLKDLTAPHLQTFLPEGETHPQARKLITQVLQDVLLFAIDHLSVRTPIVLEAPLIGCRGEDLIETLGHLGLAAQIFIMHSPTMRAQILRNPQLTMRETSAAGLAMRQIHEALLRQRAISCSEEAEDVALKKSWEHWLNNHEGIVLAWHPVEDEEDFIHTRKMLEMMNFTSDPLSPDMLCKYTLSRINQILEQHDLHAFAREVQNYDDEYPFV